MSYVCTTRCIGYVWRVDRHVKKLVSHIVATSLQGCSANQRCQISNDKYTCVQGNLHGNYVIMRMLFQTISKYIMFSVVQINEFESSIRSLITLPTTPSLNPFLTSPLTNPLTPPITLSLQCAVESRSGTSAARHARKPAKTPIPCAPYNAYPSVGAPTCTPSCITEGASKRNGANPCQVCDVT